MKGKVQICTVFFKSQHNSENLHPIELSWGLLPELWIGRLFQNGSPCKLPISQTTSVREFNTTAMQSIHIVSATEIPRALDQLNSYRIKANHFYIIGDVMGQFLQCPHGTQCHHVIGCQYIALG